MVTSMIQIQCDLSFVNTVGLSDGVETMPTSHGKIFGMACRKTPSNYNVS